MTAGRILLTDMKSIITAALAQGDYEHDAEWIRPESCSCHRGEQSCLLRTDATSCQGRAIDVPTPDEHLVSLDILTRALPAPDPDGTVGTEEAALSILTVITDRLCGDYILRAHSLVRRLTEISEEYETAHGVPAGPGVPATASSGARCMVCSKPLDPKSKASRKTCSDNCRARLYQRRKRAANGKAKAAVKP